MTPWQRVFRDGIAPQLSDAGLEALERALARDDRAVMQNTTTFPPPLQCMADLPIEAACPVAYALWQAQGLGTVGEVETAFALLCQRVGEAMGEPTAIRPFLNHVDEIDRRQMRRELLAEVRLALVRRRDSAA
jgi:hypothetical protein